MVIFESILQLQQVTFVRNYGSITPLKVPLIESTAMSELDRLIDLIPIGLFHYRLLLMCGLAFMADVS